MKQKYPCGGKRQKQITDGRQSVTYKVLQYLKQ